MKNKASFILTLLLTLNLCAQDLNYVRYVVDTLSAPGMHGRGYVNEGEKIASQFVHDEFMKSGLKSFGEDYFQSFSISINTFPDTMNVWIDDRLLRPGFEYTVLSSSPSVDGTFELVWLPKDSVPDSNAIFPDYSGKVVISDLSSREIKRLSGMGAEGYIFIAEEKVRWHVAVARERDVKDYFALQILRSVLPEQSKSIQLRIRSRYYEDYPARNVIGYIEGKIQPDSFMVFIAHYDHLGRMGRETYFPGAHDNASGTAMILDLARHYSKPENRPDYSVAFMAFGAEEAGLLGSFHYLKNPLFPLENILFLINFDMVGSGSEGISVANGVNHPEIYEILAGINAEREYLPAVLKRGEASNSDHYPFHAAGVPCFFIFTLGPECKEYHNVYDTPDNLPLTEYEGLFRLMVDFVNTY
ncbi:MAG: M28 family metallopeptidase [Bacteroidales bacterium]